MNLSRIALKRPVTTFMVVLCLVVLGLVSLTRLSLDMYPDISFPHLWIRIPYPSSTPEEVERLIVMPVEEAIGKINNLKSIRSTASSDGASIGVELKWKTNMDSAMLEIREALDMVRAELPDDVENIYIYRFQSTDRPIIRCSVSMPVARDRLYEVVEKVIKPRLERINGVANVEVRGLASKEVQVKLNEALVKAFRVNPYSLAYDLRTGNFDLSLGKIFFGGKRLMVRALGELESHIDVMKLPVREGNVRVGDFSDVTYDFPEEEFFQSLDHQRAVSLRIFKASRANVVEVSREVNRLFDDLRRDPKLPGLSIFVYYDQATEILRSLANLRQAGILGALLAIVVIFFFLRKFRSTLIIAIAIPTSVIFTFLLMYFLGISMNIISITALALAAGMLVDNAVVVLESIYSQRQRGLSSVESALVGADRVSLAITAATLTTIIVFIPLIFLSESRFGLFMRDFGLTISTALVASLLIALTLIPLLSERLFRSPPGERTGFVRFLEKRYVGIISWTLTHRAIAAVATVLLLIFSFYLSRGIKREYFPQVPERTAYFKVEVPNGYSFEKLKSMIGEFERRILEQKETLEVENVASYFSRRGGTVVVFFKKAEERKKNIFMQQKRVRKLFPGAPGVKFEMSQRRGMHGGSLGLTIEITGRDYEVLKMIAERVRDLLEQMPGVEDITTDTESGTEEVIVRVNRDLSARYGLSAINVARMVVTAYSSRPITRIDIEGNEVEVVLQYRERDRLGLGKLNDMYLLNMQGKAIPLGALCSIEIAKAPASITRENRRRIISVMANTDSRRGMAQLSRVVQKRLSSLNLPPGYNWRFGEEFRLFRESERQSWFAILVAIALIYILMASLFESLIHPFTIMFSIPFAFIGVAVLFRLTGTSINNISMLGLMILSGIVVNNGIVLIHHVNNLRKDGQSQREALINGGRDRLRPILMAALTTILGLVPIAFGRAEGRGAIWAPMGKAVIGGLITSTFLTLVLIPMFYSILDDLSAWLKRVFVYTVKH